MVNIKKFALLYNQFRLYILANYIKIGFYAKVAMEAWNLANPDSAIPSAGSLVLEMCRAAGFELKRIEKDMQIFAQETGKLKEVSDLQPKL